MLKDCARAPEPWVIRCDVRRSQRTGAQNSSESQGPVGESERVSKRANERETDSESASESEQKRESERAS
eukprot:2758925-Rhodomonas_salina.2